MLENGYTAHNTFYRAYISQRLIHNTEKPVLLFAGTS